MKLARGPVVEALKRYDPGLRVRWSPEKGRWAVDAPWKQARACPPPVRFLQVGEGAHGDWWTWALMPELSERYIQYRDKRYVVCFAKRVDWRLYAAVVRRDMESRGFFRREFDEPEEAKVREAERRKDDRVYEAWHRFRSNLRRNPHLEDGTGTSIKGLFA